MGPALLSLVVAALSSTTSLTLEERAFGRVELRVASGAEWDTNAFRAVSGADTARASPVTSDGLMRLLVDASGQFQLSERHALSVGYTLGAKRFFEQGTEDLWAHDFGLSTEHRLWDRWTAGLNGTLRASRIRNGSRDYWIGIAGAHTELALTEALTIDVSGQYLRFGFRNDRHFDYGGPRAGLGLTVRPLPKLAITGHGDFVYRRYDGNGLVVASGTIVNADGSTRQDVLLDYCEDPILPDNYVCTPRLRRDTEVQLAAGVTYRGSILLGAQYLLRLQRSTSELEDVDRHRVTAFGTLGLPLNLTFSVLAALQVNVGASATDNRFLAEDDENQNSVQAQLRRPLFEGLSLELRYAFFANQFSTAAASLVRHTVYLGVSYRLGLFDDQLSD